MGLRSIILSILADLARKTYFEHFSSLGLDIGRIGLRRKSSLSIFVACPRYGQDVPQNAYFEQHWPRCSQNGLQKAYFEHFGNLGSDRARMSLRRPILSILAALAQILLEWVSESIF